jgi:hypothetical protein
MKIALCFIISYEHILNKEKIWREWIEPNKDIINVYFYYKDFKQIQSTWIKEHTIPIDCIYETSYYYVIPAYLSILNFASIRDKENTWFCMLTDSCCPIISPKHFRYLFYKYNKQSLFSWKYAWWNPNFHKRANLAKLPKELRLANDPWFILTRENVNQILYFVSTQKVLTKTICDGGLANESLFAIILKFYNKLDNNIINTPSHLTDWNRRSSTTSPHLFKDANEEDIDFIEKELERNEYTVFIRKIAPEFPDEILRYYIYDKNKEKDEKLILIKPDKMIFKTILDRYKGIICIILMVIILYEFIV